ncbi:MAG TPA: cupredoxin domain-containing protein [Solirubrobacteraceae bacterium]|jgi:hypothetical protein
MPRSSTAAALVAIALVAGGCGGDDTFRTQRPVLRVTLDEYRIVPQDIEVKAGRMKLEVRNTGRLTHNLAIQVPGGPNDKPTQIARVATMQPGQTAAPVKVTLAPGEYRLVCTIANHDDLGQFGTLKVR